MNKTIYRFFFACAICLLLTSCGKSNVSKDSFIYSLDKISIYENGKLMDQYNYSSGTYYPAELCGSGIPIVCRIDYEYNWDNYDMYMVELLNEGQSKDYTKVYTNARKANGFFAADYYDVPISFNNNVLKVNEMLFVFIDKGNGALSIEHVVNNSYTVVLDYIKW